MTFEKVNLYVEGNEMMAGVPRTVARRLLPLDPNPGLEERHVRWEIIGRAYSRRELYGGGVFAFRGGCLLAGL